ncbi:MAG: hypothetical protein WD826_11910 [Actinomycetota bacterium]
MRLLRVAPIAIVLAAALLPTPAGAEALLEAQVISKIRAARPAALIVHTGLQAAARHHSANMSRSGGLNHNGADARVNSAPPDPAEGNGAPDDGFGVASWCENVTYSMSVPEHQVAQRIYDQWHRSDAHDRCMMDGSRNVGAVGIYYDGQTWWATFIAQTDTPPPGGSRAPKPEPSEAPAPTQAPQASAPSQPVASAPVTQPLPASETDPIGEAAKQVADGSPTDVAISPDDAADVPPEPSTITLELVEPATEADVASTDVTPDALPVAAGYGWQELAGLSVVLLLATFFLRRATRSPVPKPEVFLEWAAANEREPEPVGVS